MKMSAKEAAALGLEPRRHRKADLSAGDPEFRRKLFLASCTAHGIPLPHCEWSFAKHLGHLLPEHMRLPGKSGRDWRFDFCWVGQSLALEAQGGIFTGGRHVRGAALLDEYQKLQAAVLLQYRVLLTTWKEIEAGTIFSTIKAALAAKEQQ